MKRSQPPKRKTPLKRSTKRLKRVALRVSSKPLPKRSKKKLAALGDEIAFRDAVRERSQGLCEGPSLLDDDTSAVEKLCGTQRFSHSGAHAHHVYPSDRDRHVHDPDRGLWLCAYAHMVVHTSVEWAYEHRLLGRSGFDESSDQAN